MTRMIYPFTATELNDANDEWGCNCGPSALAFALQRPLADVRPAIPDFETKGYTSPTMMKAALNHLKMRWYEVPYACKGNMCQDAPALTRIQWTGPWTKPGTNPKWAYWHTHWIVTYWEDSETVFDCNGGVRRLDEWESEIVPALLADNKRADGGWLPTHVWQLMGATP